MTSDGGYWPTAGRHRPDRGEYGEDSYDQHGHNGRGDAYQDSGSYQRPDWNDGQDGDSDHEQYANPQHDGGQYDRGQYDRGQYGEDQYGGAGGYDEQRGYDAQAGYGDPYGYADSSGYGDRSGYGDPLSYGVRDGYDTGVYGGQASGSYGSQSGYGDSGYSQSGYGEAPYGEQAGSAGSGQPSRGQSGRGRHSAGPGGGMRELTSGDPYGAGQYGATQYGTSDYGAGDYGAGRYEAGADQHPYGGQEAGYGTADPYGPASTAGSVWQDQYGQADPLTGSYRADDTGSYGTVDTGSHSWAFTPGTHDEPGYGQDLPAYGRDPEPLPGEGTGGFGIADSGVFGRPDSGSFGRPDTGSFGRPDTGSFGRPDTGSFGRPDTGSFGIADSGAFGRPDTGSFRRADSGVFGRQDTGSFDRDDDFDSDSDHDTGSIRWTAGPPELRSRADRDEPDDAQAGRGTAAGELAGRPDWERGDDWQDEEDGLLSRRFGGRAAGSGELDMGGGGRGRVRGRKRRRFRGRAASSGAIIAVVLIVLVGGFFGYRFVNKWLTNRYGDYSGPGTGVVKITVTTGDTLVGLGPTLVKDGVIMTVRPYNTAAAASTGILQPGVYKLRHHMNAALAVKRLLDPKARIQTTITVIEGTRASTLATQLAAATGIDAKVFTAIIDNPPAALGLPSWAPKGVSAEGFLFPDTYTFLPHEPAMKILQTMVSTFNQQIASLHLPSEAAKVFTTPYHVLIVASMVQAEGGRIQDFPGISRVAWNRLKLGRPLEFDSTVFYAMGTHGTAITLKDEKFPSKYNTYLHTGLPPGPIGNPGIDAITAALHPVKANYLYFITDTRNKPYVTHFTNSYQQFQQWQQKFQN